MKQITGMFRYIICSEFACNIIGQFIVSVDCYVLKGQWQINVAAKTKYSIIESVRVSFATFLI